MQNSTCKKQARGLKISKQIFMDLTFWIAIGVFSVSLLFFIFDWLDKTIVALLGALILMVTGVLTWEESLLSIDIETLTLLFGLMLVVAVAQYSGIFSWLNVQIAQRSKGSPMAVFLSFMALTFLTSTVLNNATVIILVVPIAIALARGLGLNTKLLVIALAIFSNIGGTLTLIGDPPNTLIGVQAGLSFNSFIINLWVPIAVMTVLITGYMILLNPNSFKSIRDNFKKLFISNLIIKRITYQFANVKLSKFLVISTCLIILASILAFMFQPYLGIELGVLGLLAGIVIVTLASKKIDFVHMVKEIEWDSLLFFAALFVQVGALEKVGFLQMITDFIVGFSGNFAVLLLVIVWGIGIASMFINNIPFVALMIPVIFQLQDQMAGQPDLDLLWWALALGACLGGNGTIIGSSSGILAVDMAKKHGVRISFLEFMKVGVPVTLISLVVASGYLLARLYI